MRLGSLAHFTSLLVLLTPMAWMATALITPSHALAQDDDTQGITQIVILDVPLDGTRTLAESIAKLGDSVALYPQTWFEERVDEQGFDPDGLLANRNALSIVMEESDIDVVIISRYSSKRELYRISIVPQDPRDETLEFDVAALEDEGLTGAGAAQIRKRLVAMLDAQKAELAPPPDPEKPKDDPNALREAAIAEQKAKKNAGPKGAAKIAAGFRLIEPTFILVTATSELTDSLAVTLGSSPGFALYAEIFPMLLQEDAEEDAKNFGILLNYNQVFQSLALSPTIAGQPADMIAEPVDTGLSYLDLEGGAFYNLTFGEGEQAASLRGKFLLRLQRLSTAVPVSQFQTFRFFSIGLGADGIFPLGTTGAKLLTSVELAPFTSATTPQEGIGTIRYAYTLSGSLGVSYDFTPNIGFTGSYIFDNTRILFNREAIPQEPGSTTAPVERAPKASFSANGLFAGVHYIY